VFGIFLPGLKNAFFVCFSPFFSHIVTAMLLKKRAKQSKKSLFHAPAKIPEHALSADIVEWAKNL
jgi:hypothetical protein